jgi:hypothetical protein
MIGTGPKASAQVGCGTGVVSQRHLGASAPQVMIIPKEETDEGGDQEK